MDNNNSKNGFAKLNVKDGNGLSIIPDPANARYLIEVTNDRDIYSPLISKDKDGNRISNRLYNNDEKGIHGLDELPDSIKQDSKRFEALVTGKKAIFAIDALGTSMKNPEAVTNINYKINDAKKMYTEKWRDRESIESTIAFKEMGETKIYEGIPKIKGNDGKLTPSFVRGELIAVEEHLFAVHTGNRNNVNTIQVLPISSRLKTQDDYKNRQQITDELKAKIGERIFISYDEKEKIKSIEPDRKYQQEKQQSDARAMDELLAKAQAAREAGKPENLTKTEPKPKTKTKSKQKEQDKEPSKDFDDIPF